MRLRAAQEPRQPAIAGWSPMPTSSPCCSPSSSSSIAFAKADQKKQTQVTEAIDSAFHSLGIFPDASRKPAQGAPAGTEQRPSP